MKKKVLSLLLAFVMVVSLVPGALAAEPATFKDVNEDMWCFDYVEYVAEKGYFKGTTATTFNPNGTMTRQQFVTVLARMAGVEVDNSKTAFSDVPVNTYATGSVAWAAKEGIVTGYADGTFHPTAPVTRQQMCAFMDRFMDYYADAHGVYFLKKATVSGFVDYDKVSDYAKTSVDRCRTYGLIQGYAEDNTFRPTNSATRAHVAAVIYRLAQVIKEAAGGGPGGFIPTPTTYTLTYKNTNVPTNTDPVTKDVQQIDNATFPVLTINAVDSNVSATGEYLDQVFVQWVDEADPTVGYGTGKNNETITLTGTTKTVVADWAAADDLLYLAIVATANAVDTMGNQMAAAFDQELPYATLINLDASAPSQKDTNNARTVSIAAEGELSTDIVSRMIETATYYAVTMIGTPADFVAGSDADKAAQADAISKAEVREIVAELLDLIDPTEIWWEGEGRIDKIENLASKIYENLKANALNEGKPYVGGLWNDNYKNDNGTVLFTEVDLLDKDGNVVVTAKADKKLYDAADNQLGYKQGLIRVAKAVAKELYADLKTKTTYQTNLELAGQLTLDFTMNTADGIAAVYAVKNYPTTYHVAAELALNQVGEEDYLAYKFVNGRPYVKLIITTGLQADYEKSVNAIAEAAMTNGTLKAALSDKLVAMLVSTICDADLNNPNDMIGKLLNKLMAYDSEITADLSSEANAEAYVLNAMGIAKSGSKWVVVDNGAVDLWLDENLSTEGTPTGAPYYLPFDFFWNLGGTVNADGSLNVPTRAAAPVLGNNEDLVDAVELLINEVVNSVAAPVYAEYGMDPADMETSIKNLLNTKINEKLTPAVIADLQDQIVDAAASNFDTLKGTIETEGTKLVKKAALLSGMTGTQFNTYWDGLSSTQKADEIAEFLDVNEVLNDLFGTTTSAGLTIAKIDAAAAYEAAPYNENVETAIRNVTTVAQLQALLPDFAELVKDTTSETLYTVISAKVDGKMGEVAGTSAYVGDLLQVSYAETYLRELLLGKLGFTQAFNATRLISGVSLEDRAVANMADKAEEIIADAIADERAALGLSADKVEEMLNNAVAKACGTYSQYLNKIGVAKSISNLSGIELQSLVNVMKSDIVLDMVSGKVAPKYVEAVAKAITKIEGNPSSITIDGVTVTGTAPLVKAVKDASESGNAKALCTAVANFLAQWGDLSIASFAEPGVAVDVVASAKGYGPYEFGANFVIEVAQ